MRHELTRKLQILGRSPVFWTLVGIDLLVLLPVSVWLNREVSTAYPTVMSLVDSLAGAVSFLASTGMAAVCVVLPLNRHARLWSGCLASGTMAIIQFFSLFAVAFIVMSITQPILGSANGFQAGVAMLYVGSIWSGSVIPEAAQRGIGQAFVVAYQRFKSRFWLWLVLSLVANLSAFVWWPVFALVRRFPFVSLWVTGIAFVWAIMANALLISEVSGRVA